MTVLTADFFLPKLSGALPYEVIFYLASPVFDYLLIHLQVFPTFTGVNLQ